MEGKRKKIIEMCIKNHGLETLTEETILWYIPSDSGRCSQAAHPANPVRNEPGVPGGDKAKI